MTGSLAVPSSLPTGWRSVELGDVAKWSSGGTPTSTVDAYYGGDTPWAAISDLNDGVVYHTAKTVSPEGIDAASLKVVPQGTVLVAMYGSIGKLGIAGRPLATNQAIARAEVDPEVLEASYLFYALLWARRELKRAGRGATQSNIGQGTLKRWEIPLPPLDEQAAIVALIEKHFSVLNHGVSNLQQSHDRLPHLRESILDAAIRGELLHQNPDAEPAEVLLKGILVERRATWEQDQRRKAAAKGKTLTGEAWKARYSEPVPPALEGLAELPPGWIWTTLDAVTQVQGGLQKQPRRAPAANSYPFLRVANVGRGTLHLDDVHRIELFDGELPTYELKPGDLLIVEGNGSQEQIGRSAMWDASISPCVHQNHLIRARPLPGLLGRYLLLYWNSPQGARRVRAEAQSTSGLYTLSTAKVKRLPIPLPPVEEQRRIVDEVDRRLSFVDAVGDKTQKSLEQAKLLRRSLLHAAFTGRLTGDGNYARPGAVSGGAESTTEATR